MCSNEALREKIGKSTFEPYIRSITFPFYKNLRRGTNLTFTFPITVLVGRNGFNKSSILRALYGCPEGNSTGTYWFSTKLDPIEETEGQDRNCYFYTYREDATNCIVQVLKMRINYDKNNVQNPDYWEPARPKVSIGMDRKGVDPGSPVRVAEITGGLTRWPAIRKNVLLLDFRAELSAFDKYFYFGKMRVTKRLRTKQDRLRAGAVPLKTCIDKNRQVYFFNGRKRRNVIQTLDPAALEVISDILGRRYTSIVRVEHSFYGDEGTSFRFTWQHGNPGANIRYSEAFAGSGEFAVATLVSRIMETEQKSLVLLDEPETSLHPGAQRKLMEFLRREILRQGHQVVMATHSPVFVDGLPPDAVKVLEAGENGEVEIMNECLPLEAFSVLGERGHSATIYTEDPVAAELVERVLRRHHPRLCDGVRVVPLRRGAENTWKTHVVSAAESDRGSREFFLFDGDQSPDRQGGSQPGEIIGDLEEKTFPQQEECLQQIAGKCHQEMKKLIYRSIPGGKRRQLTEDERNRKKNMLSSFLTFVSGHVRYLPFAVPEKWLMDALLARHGSAYAEFAGILPQGENPTAEECKAFLRNLAVKRIGGNPDSIGAQEIFAIQKSIMTDAEGNEELWDPLLSVVEEIVRAIDQPRR